MDFIALPACNDETASLLFWTFAISCLVGRLIYLFLTKFDLFDSAVRPYVIAFVILGLAAFGVCNLFYTNFTGVTVSGGVVRLHYPLPRAPVAIDAASINRVEIGTNLQLYRPTRSWKHDLVIQTDQKREYASVDVCIPKNKVGTDYQSAMFTRINDPVEKAQEAIALAAIKAKFASGKVQSIPPNSYVVMFVKVLRRDSNNGEAGIQGLNDLLAITRNAFGDKHYTVGLVYRFIGRSFGIRGDLKNAKIAFAEAGKCDMYNHSWAAACEQMNEDGLNLTDFTRSDFPRPAHYAGEF